MSHPCTQQRVRRRGKAGPHLGVDRKRGSGGDGAYCPSAHDPELPSSLHVCEAKAPPPSGVVVMPVSNGRAANGTPNVRCPEQWRPVSPLQRRERTTARSLDRQETVPRQFGVYRNGHIGAEPLCDSSSAMSHMVMYVPDQATCIYSKASWIGRSCSCQKLELLLLTNGREAPRPVRCDETDRVFPLLSPHWAGA